jgi:hypothetical protein
VHIGTSSFLTGKVMARRDTGSALAKHGYTFDFVKGWTQREYDAGRPSGIDDFFRAHGHCAECGGYGQLLVGVRWRDSEGVERSEAGPVAVLLERYSLHNPVKWLNDKLKWDYLYEPCSACGGSGQVTPPV